MKKKVYIVPAITVCFLESENVLAAISEPDPNWGVNGSDTTPPPPGGGDSDDDDGEESV